jgi:hypothetical protein
MEPFSFKGAIAKIKLMPIHWQKVYAVMGDRSPALSHGKRFTVMDNSPTWKHNAMAPNKGEWVLLGTIEGFGDSNFIPVDCLDFEGLIIEFNWSNK